MHMLLEAETVEQFEALLETKLFKQREDYGIWTSCLYEENRSSSSYDEGSVKAAE